MTQFDFYLNNLSFQSPDNLEIDVLRTKIEQLSIDCEFIREHEEKIYRHPSIYEETIIYDYSVMDVLYRPEISAEFGNDYHFMLQIIIDRSIETDTENEIVIACLEDHSEELVSGLLCLHQVEQVNPNYCVYDKNDWFDFHRHFLCVYPPLRTEFCEKLMPYFPNLYFHPLSVPATLRSLHVNHSEIMTTIIHHLKALNDVFWDIFKQEGMSGNQACDELENHFRSHAVRIGASRHNNNCDELKISFDRGTSEVKILYCDLHTKFYQYFEYDNPSYQAKGNRVYFHQPIKDYKDNKILVVWIGEHACS